MRTATKGESLHVTLYEAALDDEPGACAALADYVLEYLGDEVADRAYQVRHGALWLAAPDDYSRWRGVHSIEARRRGWDLARTLAYGESPLRVRLDRRVVGPGPGHRYFDIVHTYIMPSEALSNHVWLRACLRKPLEVRALAHMARWDFGSHEYTRTVATRRQLGFSYYYRQVLTNPWRVRARCRDGHGPFVNVEPGRRWRVQELYWSRPAEPLLAQGVILQARHHCVLLMENKHRRGRDHQRTVGTFTCGELEELTGDHDEHAQPQRQRRPPDPLAGPGAEPLGPRYFV